MRRETTPQPKSGKPYPAIEFSSRADGLNGLFQTNLSGIPFSLEDDVQNPNFLSSAKEEQDSGQIRKLIPEAIFEEGNPIAEHVGEIRKMATIGMSFEGIVQESLRDGDENKRKALGVFGVRLLQLYHPSEKGLSEGAWRDPEKSDLQQAWEGAGIARRQIVRMAQMLIHRAQIAGLEKQSDLSHERYGHLAESFKDYAKIDGIPADHVERLEAAIQKIGEQQS